LQAYTKWTFIRSLKQIASLGENAMKRLVKFENGKYVPQDNFGDIREGDELYLQCSTPHDRIQSLRRAVEFGLATGKRNLIVDLEVLAEILQIPRLSDIAYRPVEPNPAFNDPAVRAELLKGKP